MSILHMASVDALDGEISNARKKFPAPDGLFVALIEEFGEACDAALTRTPAELRRELLQVACVAMRLYEEGDPFINNGFAMAVIVRGADLEQHARKALIAMCGQEAGAKSE